MGRARPKGDASSRWKGGRSKRASGYVYLYAPDHPNAVATRYVLEHRLVMEAHLGRVLLPSEHVHHINGIKDDNRVENLELYETGSRHHKEHQQIMREMTALKAENERLRALLKITAA